MQKIIDFPDVASSGRDTGRSAPPVGNLPGSPSRPPSIEPIYAVVDSLSRTLECIKAMYATAPNGPIREKLEIERTNLVIGLFVARIASMRVSSNDSASAVLAEPELPLARRG